MATIGPNLARTSTAMTSDLMMSNLRRSHRSLLEVQQELATGQRVNRPSDAPQSVGLIRTMQAILSQFAQDRKALNTAANASATADQSLAEVTQLVMQAQNIASSQIGIGSDAGTRASQAAVVESLIETLVQVGNTEHNGVYLFGGERASERPFVERLGGIEYRGAKQALTQTVNGVDYALNATGSDALGALSSRVQGRAELTVAATGDTRIASLEGARDLGVKPGTVRVTVNGVESEVDLRGVERLSDVAGRINEALGGAGTLSVTATGFSLTAGGGDSVTIADFGTGTTAADLGIAIAASGGATTPGDPVQPRLTEATRLSEISGAGGAAIDWASGLKITNGGQTKVVSFGSAETVEDMINLVEQAEMGVELGINGGGRGLSLINRVNGTELSIGEAGGGTTAGDLGLRSFAADTELAELNHGKGVRRVEGEADLRIDMGDGATSFEVNLDGATSVQDVIDAMDAAATAAGVGGDLTVSLAADGNGFVLISAIAGGGPFGVSAINGSRAAEDLGIDKQVSGGTIEGDDTATIRTESALTHLMMLRDALLANDERQITEAGELLHADVGRVAGVRARTGVQAERVEAALNRIEDRTVQTEAMLSDLRDSDYAEAVSRFTRLQQQLEATLLSGQQVMRLSLLDFLR